MRCFWVFLQKSDWDWILLLATGFLVWLEYKILRCQIYFEDNFSLCYVHYFWCPEILFIYFLNVIVYTYASLSDLYIILDSYLYLKYNLDTVTF